MATLTVRYDIPARGSSIASFMRVKRRRGQHSRRRSRKWPLELGQTRKNGFGAWVVCAPEVLPGAAPDIRQGLERAITAWALDLSAGHPTRQGTIDEFLDGSDFLVIIIKTCNASERWVGMKTGR
jgi:hypothetical protein